MTTRLILILVLLAGALVADPQPQAKQLRKGLIPPPPAQALVIEKLRRMTPEERERVLGSMPPGRRRMFEQRLEQWNRLDPEQKKRLEGSLESFRTLTTEQQETVRGLFRKFSETMPEDKRGEGRRMLARLRNLEPDERKALLNAPRVKARFTDSERDLLAEMAEKLPD
ncbi:MAG: DUF3106 domain-containing protein [Acidobacteria bacterium]|nr:DUF3106 domain-containing protein [Acidobacteriota bacterium]